MLGIRSGPVRRLCGKGDRVGSEEGGCANLHPEGRVGAQDRRIIPLYIETVMPSICVWRAFHVKSRAGGGFLWTVVFAVVFYNASKCPLNVAIKVAHSPVEQAPLDYTADVSAQFMWICIGL